MVVPIDDSEENYRDLGLLSIDHKQLHRPDLLNLPSLTRDNTK